MQNKWLAKQWQALSHGWVNPDLDKSLLPNQVNLRWKWIMARNRRNKRCSATTTFLLWNAVKHPWGYWVEWRCESKFKEKTTAESGRVLISSFNACLFVKLFGIIKTAQCHDDDNDKPHCWMSNMLCNWNRNTLGNLYPFFQWWIFFRVFKRRVVSIKKKKKEKVCWKRVKYFFAVFDIKLEIIIFLINEEMNDFEEMRWLFKWW